MGKPRTPERERLEDRKAEIVKAYEREKRTIRYLAGEYGASYQKVREVLVRAGVHLRGRGGVYGGPNKPSRRQHTQLAKPTTGDVVSLQEVRELAGLTQVELAGALDLTGARIAQIEATPMGRLRFDRIVELVVDGCAARLQVLVVFDDVTVALYDSEPEGS